MMNSGATELNEIQKLQFSDRPAAEQALLVFIKRIGHVDVESISINPKPESLNSVNGFARFRDGAELFFKSHTEEDEKLGEYYRSSILGDVGYPVVTPRRVRSLPGEQIAFYEPIRHETLFDLISREEDLTHDRISPLGEKLLASERRLYGGVSEIYTLTLAQERKENAREAAINQLFSWRLKEDGRWTQFYRDKVVELGTVSIPFQKLATLKWTINGVKYAETLGELAERGRNILDGCSGWSVIGHGDAHNGNIFFDAAKEELLFFDAAFAGRHCPILDCTKPLFHNHFARWMYFPEKVAKGNQYSIALRGEEIRVEHDFYPSAIRCESLQLFKECLLGPAIRLLIERGADRIRMQSILRAALFCCPMLTVNIAAAWKSNGTLAERYSPISKILGLCSAITVAGTPGSGRSRMSDLLAGVWEAYGHE